MGVQIGLAIISTRQLLSTTTAAPDSADRDSPVYYKAYGNYCYWINSRLSLWSSPLYSRAYTSDGGFYGAA